MLERHRIANVLMKKLAQLNLVYVLWNQLVGLIAKQRENPLENVKDGIVNASHLATQVIRVNWPKLIKLCNQKL